MKDDEKTNTAALFKKVSELIRNNPKNWRSNLEELGFEWYDDDEDEDKIAEERAAQPLNINQEYLVAYFEGRVQPNDEWVQSFAREREADKPNYPLFRRYFRAGNENLRNLLMYALSKYPTRQDWLSDLVFFHEHKNILKDVIACYSRACKEEKDFSRFREIARDFIESTEPEGYDALAELKIICKDDPEKNEFIDEMENEKRVGAVDDIEF
jgi:hypothetical protein